MEAERRRRGAAEVARKKIRYGYGIEMHWPSRKDRSTMPIPRGTRQLVPLREFAVKLGTSHDAAKHWWREGYLVGRLAAGGGPRGRKRITVPIEVVDFYLRYHRLPTKMELYESGALTMEYLLEAQGPDGGLEELAHQGRREKKDGGASKGGTLRLVPSS